MDAADGQPYLQVDDTNQAIGNLRNSIHNRLWNFGQQAAVNIANAIKKHRKEFHRMPVGPVGFHMSLTDTRCENSLFCWLMHEVTLSEMQVVDFQVHVPADPTNLLLVVFFDKYRVPTSWQTVDNTLRL